GLSAWSVTLYVVFWNKSFVSGCCRRRRALTPIIPTIYRARAQPCDDQSLSDELVFVLDGTDGRRFLTGKQSGLGADESGPGIGRRSKNLERSRSDNVKHRSGHNL